MEQLELEAESHMDNWLQQIQDRLFQTESLEDFRNQLDSLISELDFAEYVELLAKGMMTANLAGRQSVNDKHRKDK